MITESDDVGSGGQGSHPDGFRRRLGLELSDDHQTTMGVDDLQGSGPLGRVGQEDFLGEWVGVQSGKSEVEPFLQVGDHQVSLVKSEIGGQGCSGWRERAGGPFTQGEGEVEKSAGELITAGGYNLSFGDDLGQAGCG